MLRQINGISKLALLTGITVGMGSLTPFVASAQHSSVFHRHPNLTGAAAGYAAYHAAKHSGKRRSASGRHRNLMQRHPIATGVAAGMAAKHLAKRH